MRSSLVRVSLCGFGVIALSASYLQGGSPTVTVEAAVVGAGLQTSFQRRALSETAPEVPWDSTAARSLVDRYCIGCHNQRAPTAGLALDAGAADADENAIGAHAHVWEKVVRKLRGGLMPPPGRPRPDEGTTDRFVAWLEGELDRAAATQPNPGRTPALHRLNRTEYQNVVRDLLALDVDVVELLPPDDAAGGFDNMAGVLKLSQSLMERYLTSARKVARLAIGTAPPVPLSDTIGVPDEALQYGHVEGLPFGTRGGALIPYNFPQDADYLIDVELLGSKVEAAGYDPGSGFVDSHELEVMIDGRVVHAARLEPKPLRRLDGSEFSGVQAGVPVTAGAHEVGVTFVKLPAIEEVDGIRRRFLKPHFQSFMVPPNLAVYQPYVAAVTISGPFDAVGSGQTASRQRIFSCYPEHAAEERECATTILSSLARRAYRRPVTDADLQDLLRFYEQGRTEEGATFDTGIKVALQRVLTSADFLFRVELDPVRTQAANSSNASVGVQATGAPLSGPNHRISDLALASRLSFFLWSSIPDDELLDAAVQGQLSEGVSLEGQVRRLLTDSRSESLVESFAVQWLHLRELDLKRPDEVLFPDFDDSLREGFLRETLLFVGSILREDRSVLDLLRGNHTFVNERVAKHHGIPGIVGSHFRRVTFDDDDPRVGLLGQGSILTLTSMPNRTSPVVRGKWILENILGTPPPDPPANVPPLPESEPGARPASMREQMAQHRSSPVCASCHSMIDPPGFALENFDAVGRFRSRDDRLQLIDASGSLPDGTSFNDVIELRNAILRRPERFVTAFTEKLLAYALGRSLEYYDMPAVRAIVREAAADDYKFSGVILGVAKSLPFQMRRSDPS